MKKIIIGIVSLVIVAVATVNLNLSIGSKINNLSNISLTSIEALAGLEYSSSGAVFGSSYSSRFISTSTSRNGASATARYEFVLRNGVRIRLQVGCQASTSGSCSWSGGIGLVF